MPCGAGQWKGEAEHETRARCHQRLQRSPHQEMVSR